MDRLCDLFHRREERDDNLSLFEPLAILQPQAQLGTQRGPHVSSSRRTWNNKYLIPVMLQGPPVQLWAPWINQGFPL